MSRITARFDVDAIALDLVPPYVKRLRRKMSQPAAPPTQRGAIMRTGISLVVLVLGLAFSSPIRALAAPGDLDPTFGSAGVALGKAGGVLQIVVDPSGNL